MKPYSRCRGWIHSVNVSQNNYQMARHHNMRLIYLHTLKDYYNKHIMDANQKFLAHIIPKAWKDIILVEAHDKLKHQAVTHNTVSSSTNTFGKE